MHASKVTIPCTASTWNLDFSLLKSNPSGAPYRCAVAFVFSRTGKPHSVLWGNDNFDPGLCTVSVYPFQTFFSLKENFRTAGCYDRLLSISSQHRIQLAPEGSCSAKIMLAYPTSSPCVVRIAYHDLPKRMPHICLHQYSQETLHTLTEAQQKHAT